MDQNLNGTSGQIPEDRFAAGFTIGPCIGTDEFGYQACGYFYENIDLIPGALGVRSILDNEEDEAASIPLGSDTFNFYGNTYSGDDQLFVSTNGLISLGEPETEYFNGDIHRLPI